MIIVDDERIILESLETLIDWNAIGVEVVGIADNGTTAINLAFQLQPDIILSDISMPSFSGLEMLETLRKEQLLVEVIFITAYSKFDYAKEALKYGAYDYLLKPIDENLLLETVSQCANKIRSERSQPPFGSGSEIWAEHLSQGRSAYYDGIAEEPTRVYHNDMSVKTAILEQIKTGTLENVQDVLLDFFRLIAHENGVFEPETIRLHCFELVDHLLRELREYQLQKYLNKSDKAFNLKKRIASCATLDDAFEVTQNLIVNFGHCVREIQNSGTKRLVHAAIDYIHDNYHTDITLSQVAEHLFITPPYLSKLFSTQMHESFSQYLLSYRIKIAKELLQDTHCKIYEVAARVGYTDIAHFSKLFKRVTGQTPKQYRKT